MKKNTIERLKESLLSFYKDNRLNSKILEIEPQYLTFLPITLFHVFNSLKSYINSFEGRFENSSQTLVKKLIENYFHTLGSSCQNNELISTYSSPKNINPNIFSRTSLNLDLITSLMVWALINSSEPIEIEIIAIKRERKCDLEFDTLDQLFAYNALFGIHLYIKKYQQVFYSKNSNLNLKSFCKKYGKYKHSKKVANIPNINDLVSISNFTISSFVMATTHPKWVNDNLRHEIRNFELKRSIIKKKIIASESGRQAVIEGRHKRKREKLEELKPLIDELAKAGAKHHLIAEKIYKKTNSSGEPIWQYYTSRGIAQKMSQKEIKDFIRNYFKDTNRAYLIHGTKFIC